MMSVNGAAEALLKAMRERNAFPTGFGREMDDLRVALARAVEAAALAADAEADVKRARAKHGLELDEVMARQKAEIEEMGLRFDAEIAAITGWTP